MPLFEYQCEQCGMRFEKLEHKKNADPVRCPECHGPTRRLLHPPGIIFKGSGFYVTDNRRSSAGTRRDNTSKSTDAGEGKTESKTSDSASKTSKTDD